MIEPYQSATELLGALQRRDISSVELTELFLRRIGSSVLNAVVTVCAERARREAAEADRRRAAGELVRPLHGLPITIKDAIATAGIRTTGGSPELRDHVPTADAPAVARLRAAGAIILGKTNLPIWCADAQAYNEVFGTTRNPWQLDYTPGGSSGGSAAAVAAGLTALDIGTDIGGSIRTPAHFCGAYGLKPSHGVVPSSGYVDHIGDYQSEIDINVFGPIARHPDDLALAFDVLADPAERVGWYPRLVAPPSGPLRVATWFDDDACPVEHEYRALLEAFAARLPDEVATVCEARPPIDFAQQWQLYLDLVGAAAPYHEPSDDPARPDLSHRDWQRRDAQRLALRAEWQAWFADFDLLLCPVSATSSFRIDEVGTIATRTVTVNGVQRGHIDVARWCGIIGVLGLPAVVAPVGMTADRRPVGVQIVAPYLHDRVAVEFARRIAPFSQVGRPPHC